MSASCARSRSLPGCGTCLNVCPFYSEGNEILAKGWSEPPKEVYGGVAMDARFGAGLIVRESLDHLWAGPVGLVTLAVDLPLSLVGDTLTLPITVPAGIERAVHEYYERPRLAEPGTAEAGQDAAM